MAFIIERLKFSCMLVLGAALSPPFSVWFVCVCVWETETGCAQWLVVPGLVRSRRGSSDKLTSLC